MKENKEKLKELNKQKDRLETRISTAKEAIAKQQQKKEKLRKECELQINVVQKELTDMQREQGTNIRNLRNLQFKIHKIVPASLEVSDHAIIRYLERTKGIDIGVIKQEILSNELRNYVDTLGPNGQYPIGNSKYVVKNSVVVTIV
jgi:predicted  nucleic acid-binding Zn-ribbon protein